MTNWSTVFDHPTNSSLLSVIWRSLSHLHSVDFLKREYLIKYQSNVKQIWQERSLGPFGTARNRNKKSTLYILEKHRKHRSNAGCLSSYFIQLITEQTAFFFAGFGSNSRTIFAILRFACSLRISLQTVWCEMIA